MALAGYPPARHILSDIGVHIEVTSPTTAAVRLRATPHIAGADGGVRAGVLAVLVDILGGAVALRAVLPDWMATADLSLQLVGSATGPFVEARGAVLRKGRTTLVIEAQVANVDEHGVEVFGEDGTSGPVALATMTFAVLPGRAETSMLEVSDEFPVRSALLGDGLDRPVVETLAFRVSDAASGTVTLPVDEYLANSFGAVQGGVVALHADVATVAALEAAGDAAPGSVMVDGLQVAYLAQGRVGPIVSATTVLAPVAADGPGSAVVELIDSGSDGRLTTVVNVAARSVGPGSAHVRASAGASPADGRG